MVETGSDIPSADYAEKLPLLGDHSELIRRVDSSDRPAAIASAIEFVLEGLHLSRRLNRERVADKYLYRA